MWWTQVNRLLKKSWKLYRHYKCKQIFSAAFFTEWFTHGTRSLIVGSSAITVSFIRFKTDLSSHGSHCCSMHVSFTYIAPLESLYHHSVIMQISKMLATRWPTVHYGQTWNWVTGSLGDINGSPFSTGSSGRRVVIVTVWKPLFKIFKCENAKHTNFNTEKVEETVGLILFRSADISRFFNHLLSSTNILRNVNETRLEYSMAWQHLFMLEYWVKLVNYILVISF